VTRGTREVWLVNAAELTGELVAAAAGTPVPPLYVSVGFPKGARGGRGGRAIGQCWDGTSSADGSPHVFICPTLATAEEVLHVLVHEQVHATVGCAAGHKGAFIKVSRAVGLVKPWTATTAGPELARKLAEIADALGPFPHAALIPVLRAKPGSRLRLWVCDCGVKVRVASDDFEATCDLCAGSFKQPEEE
jgi:hypothetical protein